MPIFADANLLVNAAEKGYVNALTEIRADKTFVTPNQFREFLGVSSSAQRKSRRAFLVRERIELFGGPRAGAIACSAEFQQVFLRVSTAKGRGDAALAAFAKATGNEVVTSERNLFNFLTKTLPQLGVSIRRVT